MYSQALDEVGEFDAIRRSIAAGGDWTRRASSALYEGIRKGLGAVERSFDVPPGTGIADRLPTVKRPSTTRQYALEDIHHAGHALNGELASYTQRATARVLARSPSLEARGVSTHPFGDAYFHASLWSKGRTRMSSPLVGHLFSWDLPDKVKTDPVQFARYTRELAMHSASARNAPISDEYASQISQRLTDLSTKAHMAVEDANRGGIDPMLSPDVRRIAAGRTDHEAIFVDLLREEIRQTWGREPSLRPENHEPGYFDGPRERHKNIRGLLETSISGAKVTDADVLRVSQGLDIGMRYVAERYNEEIVKQKEEASR